MQHRERDMEKLTHEKMNTEGKIKIGSKVKVLLVFSESDTDEISVMLKSRSSLDSNDDVISIESPLGNCLLEKAVGDETEYKVGNNIVHVKVLSVD